jgi:hypothetical protein
VIVAGRAVIAAAAVLWAALLVVRLLPGTGAAAAEPPRELVTLDHDKASMAAELARQVAYCSGRQDTAHPAFRGCIDWHSAVHGVWALLAYQRATGDAQYAGLVGSILVRIQYYMLDAATQRVFSDAVMLTETHVTPQLEHRLGTPQ